MKKPCNYPGCPNLIEGRQNRYCEKHQHAPRKQRKDYEVYRRDRNPELSTAARLRNTAQWQRLRKQKLAMSPVCEDPLGRHTNRTETATSVHHIKPIVTHPELAFDIGNLMAVCHGCHVAIERETPRNAKPASDDPPQNPSGPFPGWI